MRVTLLLATIFIFSSIPNYSSAHASESDEHDEGYIVDVVVIDLSCLDDNNTTCSGWHPSNLVEYFGSDYCEPCIPVESQLAEREEDTTFIMSHHPSPSNDFWLNSSKNKFQHTYLLYGYPSLVIDGHSLLAGRSQALELENAISNSSSNYSGIASANIVENELVLSHSIEGVSIEAWTVKSYSVGEHHYTNLAVNHSEIIDENTTIDLDGDHVVIVMSVPGPIKLEMASNLPVSDYFPEGDIEYDETIFSAVDTSTVVILSILLAILILPATLQLIRLIRTPQHELFPVEEE